MAKHIRIINAGDRSVESFSVDDFDDDAIQSLLEILNDSDDAIAEVVDSDS